MKRLTLDQTWEQCLDMWKWISRRCLTSDYDVYELKEQWLDINDQDAGGDNCYFCLYDQSHREKGISCSRWCDLCPPRKIDPDFHCEEPDYDYSCEPRLFYAKLKELNKIRLGK